jgi:alkylated DNA repair protein alkB homolog 1
MMGGEARYAYHAIPRMMDGTCPTYLTEFNPETDPADWPDCAKYIKNARINMNCRQVRIPGKELKRATDATM